MSRPLRARLGPRSRRLSAVAAGALGVFALYLIIAPFLISSTVVRESMERAVAEWTGHDVSVEGVPDIRFWPDPRITLRDITIRKQSEGSERLLGRVARLSASFDLWEAVLGRPEFKDFRLTDAEISVIREASGRLDWANDGRLSRAVQDAKPEEANGQSLSSQDEARVGTVTISNGTLAITNRASGGVTRFSGINGTLDWPWLSRGLGMSGEAQLNGRKLTFDVTSTQPLLLFSGKDGNLSASIASDLFTGDFKGVANMAAHAFLSGDAELSIPDLPAAIAWSGIGFPGAERIKSLAVDARLVTNADGLRFEDLVLNLDDSRATGILDLLLPADRTPRLSGTLAFDRMDFSALIAAVAPGSARKAPQENDPRGSDLELDLRLSARQAALGPFQLSDAAASVLNIGEQSRVDILDSEFEAGRMTGRIATTAGGSAGSVAFRLSVQDADFGAIFRTLAMKGPRPLARGSLDISLDVARPLKATAWQDARGTIRFRAGQGSLPGVDLAGIRRLAGSRPYFALGEAGGGALAFTSIDISASLADGSADIRDGKIVGEGDTLSLSGVVPYANNSLALSAGIQPMTPGGSTLPLMVFIGGSWPDPVIWPISQTPPNALQ